MAENCPHCGVRLPPVSDAFCGMCRGDLSEPPDGLVEPAKVKTIAAAEPEPTRPEGVAPDDVISLLREIRDAAARQQAYLEERDRAQSLLLAAETERLQRFERMQRHGQIIWVLIAIALYLIAVTRCLW